jgi:light-regulated signal transduction histidine kinase (bacteriophytochrome)
MAAKDQTELLWPSGHEMTASIAPLEPMTAVVARPGPPVVDLPISLYDRIRMLERSNKALEHFACHASHDLQEPVRVLSLLAGRLAANDLDEEGRHLLAEMVDGLTWMRTLISDLLDYSRAGEKHSERGPVDCESVLKDTLGLLSESIAERGATVTFGKLPVIDAHNCLLGRVFQNLISNALKFARQDSPLRVHVTATQHESGWCFFVTDNGIGIEPELADEVFEPFRRLHPRDAYDGSGIGLSMCKRIVDQYGGDIWVEPVPDGGSTFCFTIPDYSTSPLRIASATAAARSDTPSF